jgi:hypothetical protein
MNNLKNISVALLALALVCAAVPASPLLGSFPLESQAAASQAGALERGYRTGYSDGYQAGYRDGSEQAPRDFRSKEDFVRANRAYSPSYGALEDYRDGYQQGFEVGYLAGYDRRPFDSTIPDNLSKRGTVADTTAPRGSSSAPASDTTSDAPPSDSAGASTRRTTGSSTQASYEVDIPANTVMRVELLTNLSTAATQKGDRFQARVLEPAEYEGAMIDGRVTRIVRPGKVKGKAEMQLSFEQIRIKDGRWANFNAQLIEVVKSGDSTVGDVDPEGGVRGKGSGKEDAAKVGAGAALGALIGAIAGGGKGAAVGAAVGGAAGSGTVLATRGEDISLYRGQQLMVRTSSDTRIR